MAQSIAPIVLRMPTAADPATLWAALTVPERVAAWFTVASPLGAVGRRARSTSAMAASWTASSASSCLAIDSRTAGIRAQLALAGRTRIGDDAGDMGGGADRGRSVWRHPAARWLGGGGPRRIRPGRPSRRLAGVPGRAPRAPLRGA